jgi:hypothetical protein
VKQQQDNNMSYVTELRPTDVLFGRGSGPNDHEGNIRFRQRVADRKDEYLATNHRLTKSKIAKEIVDSVLNENGRFLRKADEEETASLAVPDGVEVYVMVDDVTITEKAKQALRQNAVKPEAKPKKKQTTLDRLSAIEPNEDNPEDYEPIPIVISSKLNEDNPEDYEPIPIIISNRYSAPVYQEPQPMLPPTTVSAALALAAPAAAPRWDDDNSRIPMPENSNTHVNFAYGQGHATADSNMSMAQLTNEVPSSHQGRKLTRDHSMQMDDLMDSFSKMKTATNLDEQKRMMGSVETMGTIEHLRDGTSVNDMSLGSSTFSFLKGNDSMLMNSAMFDGSPDRISSNPSAQNGASNAATSHSQSSGLSESSISLSDVWSSSNGTDSKRKSSISSLTHSGLTHSGLTHSGITGEVAISVKRVMDEVRREEEAARNARLGIFHPRQVALDEDAEHFNMSDLGTPTLDALKPSLNSNNTSGHDLPSDSSAQR